MNKIVKLTHSALQALVKFFSKDLVTGKRMYGSGLILHYEIGQFIGFFMRKEIRYESRLQDKLRKYIARDSLIFDVGSNVGQYALFLSSLAPDGKVVCFEPDKKNFAFLSFNVLFNALENVELHNLGLGEVATEKIFYRDTKTGGRRGSFGVEFVGDTFEGETEAAKVSTLEEQVNKYGEPDFVKVDVEGFEFEVLLGLRHETKATVFFMEVRGSTAESVFKYFEERRFDCFMLDDEEDRRIEAAKDIPGFCNLLFIPQSKSVMSLDTQ